MQGEGQEFESPRLHHHLAAGAVTTIEQLGVHPENPIARQTGAMRPGNEPLIRVLPAGQATDQRIAGRRNDLRTVRPVARSS